MLTAQDIAAGWSEEQIKAALELLEKQEAQQK